MEREKRYRVKEVFFTLQGEGTWSGRAAVFVRLVACNMWNGYEEDRQAWFERTGAACALFCDTEFTKEGSRAMTADEILARIYEVGFVRGMHVSRQDMPMVVFTGGEPLLQLDSDLVGLLQRKGFFVTVETNGTKRLTDAFTDDLPDWIVCSPKLPDEKTVIEQVDEVKLVVPAYAPHDYQGLVSRCRFHDTTGNMDLRRALFLQPEDGPRLEEAQREAVALALEYPSWRVSVQTHKILSLA